MRALLKTLLVMLNLSQHPFVKVVVSGFNPNQQIGK